MAKITFNLGWIKTGVHFFSKASSNFPVSNAWTEFHSFYERLNNVS